MKKFYSIIVLIVLSSLFAVNYGFGQSADLIIQKTGPTQVYVGTPMSYTIIISNNGPDAISNATFNDDLPANISNVTWGGCTAAGGAVCPSAGNYSISNTNFSGTIPYLPVDGQITMIINLISPYTDETSFSNTATVEVPAGVTEVDPTTNSSTWNVTLLRDLDIEVIKTVTPTTGIDCNNFPTTIEYEVKWVNHGPSAANGFDVQDYMGRENVSFTGTGDAYFEYPYTITDLSWYSSPGTSTPATVFNNMSGDLLLRYTWQNTFNSLSNTVITIWEPNDTVILTYKFNMQAPDITGCERSVEWDLANRATSGNNSGVIVNDINSSNDDATVYVTDITCAGPDCPEYEVDIEVIKTANPMTGVDCTNLPTSVDFVVKWVNHGPDIADGFELKDYMRKENTSFTGTGDAAFAYDYSITNFSWYSSPGTSTPTTDFNPMSGTMNISSTSTSTFATLETTVIPTWEANDTIILTYTFNIEAPVITGCGRSVEWDLYNRAYRDDTGSPLNPFLTDPNNTNNVSEVYVTDFTCSTPDCEEYEVDIEVINTASTGTGTDCADLPTTIDYEVKWVNLGPDNADGFELEDVLRKDHVSLLGSGSIDFEFPFTITDLNWYSSPGTSIPTTEFNNMSGIISIENSWSDDFASLNTTIIPIWEANDTIILTFKLTIEEPTITGCGYTVEWDIKNSATIDASGSPLNPYLTDPNTSNNSALHYVYDMTCTAPPCIIYEVDIETIKSADPTSGLDCSNLPATVDFVVKWVNHGPDIADGYELKDYMRKKNVSYPGTGDAEFFYDWTISDLTWYSSPGTTSPTTEFQVMSGTIPIENTWTSTFTALETTLIPTWQPNDTIILTYKVNLESPTVIGCGKSAEWDMYNYAYWDPSGSPLSPLSDPNSSNNTAEASVFDISTQALDISISKSVTPAIVNHLDDLTVTLEFQNAEIDAVNNIYWLDTLPETFIIDESSITCVPLVGSPPACPIITYDPITRILRQDWPTMPANSGVLITFVGQVSSIITLTEYNRAYAITPCEDCIPETNFTETNYQINGLYPLPMTLVDFVAQWNNTEEVVDLKWEAMDEVLVDYYTIERRSEDSDRFEEIKRIEPQGKLYRNTYTLKDPNVEVGIRYYYRLSYVEKDGRLSRDYIEEVFVPGDKFTVKSYPNPVLDKLFVVISGKRTQSVQIEMMDILGSRVQQIIELKDTKKTHEKMSFDMSKLPEGQYYIKVVSGQRVEIQKVLHIN